MEKTGFLEQYFSSPPDESRSVVQPLNDALFIQKKVEVAVKRDDLIHPFVSGNKWRKLKYNLAYCFQNRISSILTFGGAHSNHIYATAAAGKMFGIKTIGIIRGDELADLNNTTLDFARYCGMNLIFVTRDEYRLRTNNEYLDSLQKEYPHTLILPEGGTNEHAIQGCEEIYSNAEKEHYDYFLQMVGTCGTFAGVLKASLPRNVIIGISALKGSFIDDDAKRVLNENGIINENYKILNQYHHGGYAKSNQELDDFIMGFTDKHGIPVEHVYTGKLFWALYDMIKNDYFPEKNKIMVLHSGGLRA